jgi:hypothetical protein
MPYVFTTTLYPNDKASEVTKRYLEAIKKYPPPLFILFLVYLLLQGCAVGNQYNFSDIKADLQLLSAGPTEVAVATLDQRQVVASGKCPPTYVGMQRTGLMGIPHNVNTESGLPFAEDITKSVSQSLSQKGFNPIPVFVAHGQTEQQALALLLAKRTDRSILILLKRWESDTYFKLLVVRANQTVIAETSAAENATLPGSAWNPPAAAKKQIPIAFKQAIERLLNDPKIIAVLK